MEAYFDNSATTKVTESVKNIVVKTMTEDFGNPSSMHMVGVKAERYVKEAKHIIANILKVDEGEIYFTSGGTESNNMAVIGAADANKRKGNKIITTKIEHPSVLNTMKYLEKQGYQVVYLPVDRCGIVDMETLKEEMTEDTILVSVMYVNNEVGAVEPIAEIGKYIKSIQPDVIFHVDAIQAFGKMEIRPKKENIDLLTVSGHKIHGPKGSGFIYIKKNTKLNPIIFGGGQQNGFRSGTENVSGIAGIGQAAKDAYDNLEKNVKILTDLKDYLIDKLQGLEDVVINSKKGTEGAPHIVSVSFSGVRSEVLLHALEDKGIYVSAGSACSSNKPAVSETLKAMKIDKDLLGSTIRFSFCELNTIEEIDFAVEEIKKMLPVLRKYVRR
ncbi:cysteine desulfurase family protein [uncultured Eubacterium sp.]|uniref:cysteine desulfurase family protein n=1 Tax=uncultured Eubacterium sp. TaxID=165185 RepID=UPI002673B00E|nr:cysteine desulfurase family protein [uncultured Eubacterium sp.]